jgi:phosphatidylglycerol:prolipoprotein diacylglycerol transferase
MPFLAIAFPVFDPVAISIGPFAIRWYALAYICGIVFGWIYARAVIRRPALWGGQSPITLLQLDDFILWVTLGIILGGRTGYVLFYNLDFFISHPAEIFELWKGGMSFHGGFMGCVAAVMLFCWKRNISVLSLGDITCAACFSAASPISSTASCGAGRPIPACPGPWYFRTAARCRAIPANSMKPASKASRCSSSSR